MMEECVVDVRMQHPSTAVNGQHVTYNMSDVNARSGGGGGTTKSLPLHRVQLSPKIQGILNTRGIRTARELLVMTEVELRETLDVSVRMTSIVYITT